MEDAADAEEPEYDQQDGSGHKPENTLRQPRTAGHGGLLYSGSERNRRSCGALLVRRRAGCLRDERLPHLPASLGCLASSVDDRGQQSGSPGCQHPDPGGVPARCRGPAHLPVRLCSSIGSVKTKRLSRPSALSTQIRPPYSSCSDALARPMDGASMEQSGRNQWQSVANEMGPKKRLKRAKTFAVGCDQLRPGPHGKEGVDGSSPSEGLKKSL